MMPSCSIVPRRGVPGRMDMCPLPGSLASQSGKTYKRMHTRSDSETPTYASISIRVRSCHGNAPESVVFSLSSSSLFVPPPVGLLPQARKGTSESGGWARRRRIGGHERADGRWGNRGLANICRLVMDFVLFVFSSSQWRTQVCEGKRSRCEGTGSNTSSRYLRYRRSFPKLMLSSHK